MFTVLGSVLLGQEQKFVLGVILMVPCYAIESVSALNILFMCYITPAQCLMFFFWDSIFL